MLRRARASTVVRPRLPVRLVPRHVRPGNAPIDEGEDLPRQLLDGAQHSPLAVVAERDRHSPGAGARRTADPMHIGLGHFRKLVIHDMGDIVDIDAAGRDVGRDQDAGAPGPKALERALTLRLALVSVDRRRAYAGGSEMLRDAVGAALRPGEHERALKIGTPEQFDQKGVFAGMLTKKTSCTTRSTVVATGATATSTGSRRISAASLAISFGIVAEKNRLWRFFGMRPRICRIGMTKPRSSMWSASSRTMTSVVSRRRLPLDEMVEQTSRRRHQDIDAARQRFHLRTDADAADDSRDRNADEAPIGTKTVGNLHSEFAGRREYEGAHPARRQTGRRSVMRR